MSTKTASLLKIPSLFQTKAYVGGKWTAAQSGTVFDVHNPATGEVIASMPEMNTTDVADAIEAASAAFSTFSKTTARERGQLLRKWYDLTMGNAHDIATLITLENGKTFREALGEARYAADFVEWFSEEAPRLDGETLAVREAGARVYTIREPVGVCGLITPWNWPAGMVTRKVAAALAAGCTVVLKAPAETPLTSLALTTLAERAGIPPGVINVVTTHANTSSIGKLLATSPLIKKISFTGSTRVGKILMEQASGTLKKLSLELGGNAPFIVFDDADLQAAVEGAVESKFRGSGQTCVCANRIYVQDTIYEDFVRRFVAAVEKFKVGSGFTDGVTHGPVINERSLSKIQSFVNDAVQKGAHLLLGGARMSDGSLFYRPTVLGGMTGEMLLAQDEVFGPVAGIFPFKTEAEVIEAANDTEVGLAGYFYSRDVARCYRVAEALHVGMVGVNTGLVSNVAMPFGGIGESGFGREGSKHGIAEYTTIKAVTVGGVNR